MKEQRGGMDGTRGGFTCVVLFEYAVFGNLGVQKRQVIDVTDAVAEATDLQVSLGEGLNVLDHLSPICVVVVS